MKTVYTDKKALVSSKGKKELLVRGIITDMLVVNRRIPYRIRFSLD